jgi:hypothetical protein
MCHNDERSKKKPTIKLSSFSFHIERIEDEVDQLFKNMNSIAPGNFSFFLDHAAVLDH